MKKMMRFYVSLAVSLFLAVSAFADQVETTVVSVKGDVQFSAPGSSSFEKLSKGDRLKVGSKVKTGGDGAAILAPFPGSAAQVGANSSVTLATVELVKKGDKVVQRKALIDIAQGEVITSIDKKAGKTDIKVRTPKAVVAAKGTAFRVAQTPAGDFSVVVSEGAVTVTLPDGSTRTVNAGQKLVISGGGNTGRAITTTLVDASAAEVALVSSAQQVAVALNLLTGDVSQASVGTGVPTDGAALIIINPANTSGEASEFE